MALTTKRRIFIDEYLRCFNGTEAATRANYRHPRQEAARLLAIDSIRAEIDRRLEEKTLAANEVLSRLSDMALANLADFVGVESLEDLAANDKAHVVKKLKRTVKRADGDAELVQIEIELHDAQAALEKLGRYYKLFTDKIEHSWQDQLPDGWRADDLTKEFARLAIELKGRTEHGND